MNAFCLLAVSHLDCLKAMHDVSPETLVGVLTFNDRKDPRNHFAQLEAYCSDNNLPFYVAKNRAHSEEVIQELQPELCFISGWYWLIDSAVLDKISQGCIGIHNSLLPKYRGMSPLVWSMINAEPNIGFSFFSIAEGMDEGDIWFQQKVEVGEVEHVGSVLERIEVQAAEILRNNYSDILLKKLKPEPQKNEVATYCAARTPVDGQIDWNWEASKVFDFIRAQSAPYPGAFTVYKEQILKIWDARTRPETYFGTPGQVARIDQNGVWVICGNNTCLCLTKVGFEDQVMPSNQVIKSVKTRFPSCLLQNDTLPDFSKQTAGKTKAE